MAIVYEFQAAALEEWEASFGSDNGIYVWLDGVFQGGAIAQGGASLGEHVFDLGTPGEGTHYLQVLLEDHGGRTGYAVSVTSVPEPGSATLFVLGLIGLARAARLRLENRSLASRASSMPR
ncbi:MAG: hypothetical protein QNK04_01930 [Myxococcota bacterium]|nr:hypothetical protein [Myxococcota bacterium]